MYKPRRDYRFGYAHEAIEFIEHRQCISCKFKDEGHFMCTEFAVDILSEKPVEEIDDLGDEGLVCRRYIENIL